jgi:hypothetical protein
MSLGGLGLGDGEPTGSNCLVKLFPAVRDTVFGSMTLAYLRQRPVNLTSLCIGSQDRFVDRR